MAWIASSFEGQTQVAVVGIGKPKARLEYSAGDLDLLSEVADQVGTIVSLSNLRPQRQDQIRQIEVAFDEEKRLGALYYDYRTGFLSGAGFVVLVERKNGEWTIIKKKMRWIS